MTAIHLIPSHTSNAPNVDALIALAQEDDDRASRTLVHHLIPRVTNNLIYLVSNPSDRDDIMQMVLIEVLRSLKTYQGQGFYAWVDRITVRTAMRQIKKTRWWHRRFKGSEPIPIEDHSSSEHAQRIALRTKLSAMLQKLSPERRTAIVLKHVHGYSVAEIATMTDTLENTVRGRLRSGRKQLRGFVQKDQDLHQWCVGFAFMSEEE